VAASGYAVDVHLKPEFRPASPQPGNPYGTGTISLSKPVVGRHHAWFRTSYFPVKI
jgi:hypothetical protein